MREYDFAEYANPPKFADCALIRDRNVKIRVSPATNFCAETGFCYPSVACGLQRSFELGSEYFENAI